MYLIKASKYTLPSAVRRYSRKWYRQQVERYDYLIFMSRF